MALGHVSHQIIQHHAHDSLGYAAIAGGGYVSHLMGVLPTISLILSVTAATMSIGTILWGWIKAFRHHRNRRKFV